MMMRTAALALVLSLTAPAAVRVICELSCLQALHHSSPLAHACHEQPSTDTARQTASAAAVLCHDESATPASTAVAAKAPVVVLDPSSPAVFTVDHRPAARALPPGTQARPPDLLRLTTQLRI